MVLGHRMTLAREPDTWARWLHWASAQGVIVNDPYPKEKSRHHQLSPCLIPISLKEEYDSAATRLIRANDPLLKTKMAQHGTSTGLSALPEGWSEYTTPEGLPYYHHGATNQTVWEHPGAPRDPPPDPVMPAIPLPPQKPVMPQMAPQQPWTNSAGKGDATAYTLQGGNGNGNGTGKTGSGHYDPFAVLAPGGPDNGREARKWGGEERGRGLSRSPERVDRRRRSRSRSRSRDYDRDRDSRRERDSRRDEFGRDEFGREEPSRKEKNTRREERRRSRSRERSKK